MDLEVNLRWTKEKKKTIPSMMHAWAKEVLNLKNSSRTTEIVWGCYKSSWPNYQMSYDGHEKELPRTIFFF